MKAQLQILPLVAILALFLIGPILIIIVVSFWDYTEYSLVPDFVLTNYIELFESKVTYKIYLNTIKFSALSWIFTLLIGFAVAYFLAFHVQTLRWQIILFLICTIPFWTSNIIRMIAWIPVLGRHGLVNKSLLKIGVIDEPIEWLLYSDFAVVLAFVHLYTLFMVVPIFNSMMRIDKSILEAARDAGANRGCISQVRRPRTIAQGQPASGYRVSQVDAWRALRRGRPRANQRVSTRCRRRGVVAASLTTRITPTDRS